LCTDLEQWCEAHDGKKVVFVHELCVLI
jgi:hypothetical protein